MADCEAVLVRGASVTESAERFAVSPSDSECTSTRRRNPEQQVDTRRRQPDVQRDEDRAESAGGEEGFQERRVVVAEVGHPVPRPTPRSGRALASRLTRSASCLVAELAPSCLMRRGAGPILARRAGDEPRPRFNMKVPLSAGSPGGNP